MTKLESLKKNSHFQRVLKNRVISNECFTIYRSKNFLDKKNKDKKLYISFVMRKKIGNAVKRNKIKRRLRSIVNDAVKIISINFDFSILVLAKESMLNNEYKNIKETLFQDLEKIK